MPEEWASRASILLQMDFRLWDGVMNLYGYKDHCEVFFIQAMRKLL